MNTNDKSILEEKNKENIENSSNIKLSDQKYNNKKQRKNKIIIVILSIVFIVVLCVIIVAKFFILTPKNIFLYALNNSYNNLNNKISLNNNIELLKNKTISSDINLKINYLTGNALFDYILDDTGINSLDLSMKNEIDIDNQIFNNTLNLISGNDKININLYENNNLMYVYLNDIFDKYIQLPLENDNSNVENITPLLALTSIDKDDLNYFLTQFKDNYLKKINDDDFTMTKQTVKVNDEEVKANKISYTITEKEFNNILKEIVQELKEDTNITENKELNELLNYLNSMCDENDIDNNKTFILSVYTIGLMQDSVKYSFETINDSKSYIVNYSDYANTFYVDFKTDENKDFIVNIKNINKQESKLKIELSDYRLDATIKTTSDNINIDYELRNLNNVLSGDIEFNKKDENDNYSKGDLNLTILLNKNDEDVLNLKIKGDYENHYNEELTVVDTSNNININELSEEEISDIATKLTNNAVFIKIYAIYLNYQSQNQ